MSERPQNKNLIPLGKDPERDRPIQQKGGPAAAAAHKRNIQQAYWLQKIAELPIKDKRTIAKFRNMGFDIDDEDMVRALEIAFTIYKMAKSGDARYTEIYLRLTGEGGKTVAPERDNNLLEALAGALCKEIDTGDIPELQQTTDNNSDLVEQAGPEDV